MPDPSLTQSEAQESKRQHTMTNTSLVLGNVNHTIRQLGKHTTPHAQTIGDNSPFPSRPESEIDIDNAQGSLGQGGDVSAPPSQGAGGNRDTRAFSAMAVDGSAAPSANRLIQNYGTRAKGTKKEKVDEEDWVVHEHDTKDKIRQEMEMESVVEEHPPTDSDLVGGSDGRSESDQWVRVKSETDEPKQHSAIDVEAGTDTKVDVKSKPLSRVIVLDLEAVYPAHFKLDDKACYKVPAFTTMLHQLHTLGYTVHVLTCRQETEQGELLGWLGQWGITVGTGEDDVITSIRFTGAEINQNKVDKLALIRAAHTSLYITHQATDVEQTQTSVGHLVRCLLVPEPSTLTQLSDMPVVTVDSADRQGAGGYRTKDGVCKAESWQGVLQWVKDWDQTNEADTKYYPNEMCLI